MNRKYVLPAILLVLLAGASSALTPVTSCSDLSVAGETYSLQNDVSGSLSGGNCMHITADRVTLLCNDYEISSYNDMEDIVGIQVDGANATIRGCRVSGYTFVYGAGYALRAPGSANVTIEDCSFDKNEYGPYVSSQNAIVRRSNSTDNDNWGFLFEDSPNLLVTDSMARGNNQGFLAESCDYAVIERNLADGNSLENGFKFQDSSHMRISDNNATGNLGSGFVIEANMPESYNNWTGNLAFNNSLDGFQLNNEDNNRLVGNNATGNGANGFSVIFWAGGDDANNNVFINNTASGNGYGTRCLPGTYPCPMNGFVLDMANGTLMSGNTADGNAGYGFFVYRGEGNVLDSNSASFNFEGGFIVSAHEDTRRSHNNLTNNIAYENDLFGFYIRDDSNYLAGNNATGNGASGFYLDQPLCISWACSGNNNTLINNTASDNGYGKEVYCPSETASCYDGFTLAGVNGTRMSGNSAYGNANMGFGVFNSSFNSLVSNDAAGNQGDGFMLDDSGAMIASSYNNLTGNTADSNSGNGFEIKDDHNRFVSNIAADNDGNGFFIQPPVSCSGCSAEYNELIGNTAYGNGDVEGGTSGFLVMASRNTLTDNIAYGNMQNGFWVDSTISSRATDVILSGNRAYGHHLCGRGCTGTGFRFTGTTVAVYSAFGASMDDNLAYDNDYGVLMYTGDLAMSEDRLYNNTLDLDASNPSDRVISNLDMSRVVFDGDWGAVSTYTALSLDDSLYYDGKSDTGEHYTIDHAVQPGGALPFGQPFRYKFVNITDECPPPGCLGAAINSITWHWTLGEAEGFSGISLWEYNGTWTLRNDTPLSYALSLTNLSGFSVFGLLGNYSTPSGEDGGEQTPGGGEAGQNQTSPECSADSECAVNERCSGGSCERFECGCGAIQSHQCVPYGCCSDSQCGSGSACDAASHQCRPMIVQYECTSNLQCPAQDYCNVPVGAAGGTCEPVPPQPCGEVREHAFVPYGYECGNEPGCPSCPSGSACLNHSCVSYAVTCPTTGIVGDAKVCSAVKEDAPCALCDYEVIAPDGKKSSGRTDESGNFNLPLQMEGTYRVSLMEGGQAVKAIDVKAFPQAQPQGGEKPQAAPDYGWLLWMLLLLAVLAAGLIYWRRRGNEGGKKK